LADYTFIRPIPDARIIQKGFDLGSEAEEFFILVIIQRFYSEMVPNEP
jgi:hypothetical protein